MTDLDFVQTFPIRCPRDRDQGELQVKPMDTSQSLRIHPTQFTFWTHSLLFSACLFVFFLLYAILYNHAFTLLAFSQSVAGTAAVMIGSSLALSGFSYYFDFLKKKLFYRKYFGLIGFFLAFLYAILLLFINPKRYFYGFFDNVFSADFLLGLTALGIFAWMAAISNNFMIRKLGGTNWRRSLRLGYLAYAFLVIRGYLFEKNSWFAWLNSLKGLPPPRLVVSVFAVFVIGLRLSIFIAELIKKQFPARRKDELKPPQSYQYDTIKGVE